MFSETEREKSKTRVNGNCSKIIECMSMHWRVPASNKCTACENKLVGHREELLKANKRSKEHLQVGCRAVGIRNRGQGVTGWEGAGEAGNEAELHVLNCMQTGPPDLP